MYSVLYRDVEPKEETLSCLTCVCKGLKLLVHRVSVGTGMSTRVVASERVEHEDDERRERELSMMTMQTWLILQRSVSTSGVWQSFCFQPHLLCALVCGDSGVSLTSRANRRTGECRLKEEKSKAATQPTNLFSCLCNP